MKVANSCFFAWRFVVYYLFSSSYSVKSAFFNWSRHKCDSNNTLQKHTNISLEIYHPRTEFAICTCLWPMITLRTINTPNITPLFFLHEKSLGQGMRKMLSACPLHLPRYPTLGLYYWISFHSAPCLLFWLVYSSSADPSQDPSNDEDIPGALTS